MSKPVVIEVCIDSVASALAAEQGGATRVELCANLFEGGTTPSAGCIARIRKQLSIPLNVLIRPRGGDFYYSDDEFEVMKYDIQVAKELGVDGVVIGMLQQDGSVDKKRTKELVELAKPMSITFHRAFDMTPDPFLAMEEIIELGIHRILTSGQERTAFEGADLIAQLVEKAAQRIIILPGGGITERNLRKIVANTGVRECHTSGRKSIASTMTYQKSHVFMGGELRLPEYSLSVVDAEKIRTLGQL